MTTLLNGLLGGLVVGLVAGVAATLVADDGPAVSTVFETALGREPSRSRAVGLLVATLYGGVAGLLLVALELYALGVLAVPPAVAEAFGVALVWSAVLFLATVGVRRAVADRAAAGSGLVGLAVYHLVYGVGLGVWIRMTWIT